MNTTIRFFAKQLRRVTASRDPNELFAERLTFGERLADRVATIRGSWSFIMGFGAFLVAWTVINTVVLAARAFDPFPFIFLNLMLSMLAALQAPIIMMSQNRQAAKDRFEARLDYETNCARRPRSPGCTPRSMRSAARSTGSSPCSPIPWMTRKKSSRDGREIHRGRAWPHQIGTALAISRAQQQALATK